MIMAEIDDEYGVDSLDALRDPEIAESQMALL